MEKKAEKHNAFSFHLLLGTFCISYSIGVALRLYIPELYNGEVKISGFYWLVFYSLASYVIFQFLHYLIDVIPNIIVPYMLLIGCSEGIACVAFCSYFIWVPWYSYTVGAVIGGLMGMFIILFLYPNGGVYLFLSNTAGDIFTGIYCGIITAWSITPILFPSGATDSAGNMPLICFFLAVASMIPAFMTISFVVKRCIIRAKSKFEEERQQILNDQDLYDKKYAKAEAEKEAKAKAEQERARKEHKRAERERQERERQERERNERERQEREKNERAKKEREERNRRNNQQYSRNNRSSSSGGSSRNYTGSWNNTANSYFKGCSTRTELKRRYRQLCKKLHPDCPGGNAESFRSMKSEYERLYNRMAG